MNGFQTELEKRWAAEEEQIKTAAVSEEFLAKIGDLKDEVTKEVERQLDEPDSLDGVELGDSDLYLNTPLTDKADFPLVLISYNNRTVIGGCIGFGNDGLFLHCPMYFMEMHDPQDPGKINAGLQKIHQMLSVPEEMWFKHDSMIMCYSNNPSHMNLAGMYEQAYNRIRLMEAGLTSPTVDQVQKLNS